MKTPFLTPAYQSRSPRLANNRAVNIYAEPVEASRGTGSEVGAFYARPGLGLKLTVGLGPGRGRCATDFGLFVVSGNQAYVINSALSPTLLGTIGTNSGPVSIVGNTNQIAIFDGFNGYAWSVATGFITLVLPFTNPGTAVYQDGFVLVNQIGTFTVWQSGLNDLTTWSALSESTEDGSPDNIVTMAEFHRQVILLKEKTTAFWINVGAAPFAFQRLDGVYPMKGCAAAASLITTDDKALWLGRAEEGQGTFYLYSGYNAERISTFAVEYQIAQYPTITDCIGFSFMLEGHVFCVFNFLSGNATWVYDLTASVTMKVPMWFEWGQFVGGNIARWNLNWAVQFAGLVLAGDAANGNIYALDMNTLTDNGAVKKCLRSWRHLPEAVYGTTKCNYLDIECDTGLDVPPGTNPQLTLRQSLDGGLSWSEEMYQSAGVSGEVAQDIRFTRLGATRRGVNSNRIFELSTTDQWRIGWMGAEAG